MAGGVPKTIRALIKWSSNYFINHVVTTNIMYPPGISRAIKVNQVYVYLDKILFGFKEYLVTPLSIIHLLRINPDIIHIHSFRNFQGDLAFFIGVIKHKTIILAPHGSIIGKGTGRLDIFKKIYDFLLKPLYSRFVSLWIVTSSGEGTNLQDFLGKSKKYPILQITHGINKKIEANESSMAKFSSNWDLENKFVILYVGRIHKRKGIQHVIKAIHKAKEKIGNFMFLIAGSDDGFQGELQRMVKSLDLGSHVKFIGFLKKTPAELYTAYACSNVVVVPSEYENFGHVFVESGISRRPIITSARFTDVFDENDVFHYKFGDINALAGLIVQVQNTPSLVEEKVKKYYVKLMKMDTWAEIAEKYNRVYRCLLKK